MKIETPKTDATEYASTKVKPSRMAVDADFARMLEQHEAMWRITAHLLADTLIKETDCDADESCECAGCKALVQYEKTKRATAASNGPDQRPPTGDVGLAEGAIGGSLHPVVGASGPSRK